MNNTLIEVRDLSIGHKDKILYSGISFDVHEGDCIMLCGANGSGKTTLLKALTPMGEDIIMIPTRIPKVKGFTLKEFVRITCFKHSDMGGHLSDEQERALEEALDKFGLKGLASRDISSLSDGEFQKASIASALVRKASIILLDEPTAFLDAENRISVLSTISQLCKGEIPTLSRVQPAVIFSSHDLHDSLRYANTVFALGADGKFHYAAETEGNMEAAVKRIFRTQL